MSDRPDAPARPDTAEGDLVVLSHEDCADISAEAYAWLRELPEVDDGRAQEISTMMYELLTGEWARTLHSDE